MISALENLAGPGKPLTIEPFDKQEFQGLKRSALARLKDAKNTSLSLESRFDLATTPLMLCALRRSSRSTSAGVRIIRRVEV